ncbi:hypothetical protein AGMMS49965_07520 [Bacteroidia bacterium]|nr:hypothetical protein AGMMS49965_07520 [Bacteroidia bacterium]
MKKFIFLHVVKHFVFGAVAIAGFGAVVMLLWNALVPAIFGLAVISFWQAIGLLALSRMLFGGLGGMWVKPGFGGMPRGGFGKNPLREKWEKMTPEERKEFVKNRFKHRQFGGGFEGAYERWHEHESASDESKNNTRRD